MKRLKKIYIVMFADTDNYGNTDNSIEIILNDLKDFKKWIKDHNKERKQQGELIESEDCFEITEQFVYTYE